MAIVPESALLVLNRTSLNTINALFWLSADDNHIVNYTSTSCNEQSMQDYTVHRIQNPMYQILYYIQNHHIDKISMQTSSQGCWLWLSFSWGVMSQSQKLDSPSSY